jgi:alkylated DNA repair dioxygenase AlkB
MQPLSLSPRRVSVRALRKLPSERRCSIGQLREQLELSRHMVIERLEDDFTIVRGFLSDQEQAAILDEIKRAVLAPGALTRPLIGTAPVRLEMACAGKYAWRTQPRFHYAPIDGPPIPSLLLDANDRACDAAGIARVRQEVALVNLYRQLRDGREPKLGLHRDQDERTGGLGNDEPAVISLSFGPATARFVVELAGKLVRTELHAGDACFLAGRSRRARHGVEKIDGEWRVNTTTRQVDL